jgi:hypothetical protein
MEKAGKLLGPGDPTPLVLDSRIELGGLETLEVAGTPEVVPPAPIGPEEDGAVPKPPVALRVDDELTSTEAVVPRFTTGKNSESTIR